VVVAACLDLDLDLDATEERRLGVEDEPVAAGRSVDEPADPAVVVGLTLADELVAAEDLDADPARRDAPAGVEDVSRDHGLIFYYGRDRLIWSPSGAAARVIHNRCLAREV
jgi:hypothetical protein